ncbi:MULTISPECIES: beta-ketothiolase BktB [Methyloversatilis]|uniref:beta-ketothiolase BktB n=1 Tax=Methyloversatilis TaxID=378210 RepID=UPI0026F183D7|nr:beta-ketothiolase BktB [Methyloversatilis discipulorum]MBT9516649.1 beta-ketothiolase BktB [Methyloversatilis discipulorum]
MADKREVVIVGAARTPIGAYGGSLKDFTACDLGAHVVKAAFARAGVDAKEAQHLVLGNVIHTEARDMYVSRVVAINGGMSKESCAMGVNRLCGSGFQAVVSAANAIQLGDADCAVGGGVETMSRGGYLMPAARWGARMNDTKMIDMMVGALTDPFDTVHMGITAENIASQFGFNREEQDAFAVASHQKAAAATDAGHFKSQIAPLEVVTKKGTTVIDTDEHFRRDASLEGMAKLRPVFKKDGSVTAGNASGINDGAAAIVMMEAGAAARAGAKPLARLVSYAVAGVDPTIMGTGPIPAVKLALQRAGLKASDLDVIESNEAFAVQAMCCTRELGLDPAKVNPNGGAVGLGHPVGATGAILTVKCLYELQRTGGRYGLITMCIGGGQGIAGIIERI